MARKTYFELSFAEVEKYFDQGNIKSFSERTLQELYLKKRDEWKIPVTKYATQFIAYLQKKGVLFMTSFSGEENRKKIIYSWKTQDDYTVMSGLKNGSYFSHYSAMFMHQLTLQIPKTYYLNFEHTSEMKPQSGQVNLTQDAIDKAFSHSQRKTTVSYSFKDWKVFILNGKKTNKTGVLKQLSKEQSYEYTDLERTLIDIAIRPVYAGGVFEVLGAYKNAKEKVDVIKLEKYLRKMDFIYPYHQIIGFYLEKSGYSEKDLSLFDKKKNLKFYLTYDIRNKDYSERWKLYFPKEF